MTAVHYRDMLVDNVHVFYREAGEDQTQTIKTPKIALFVCKHIDKRNISEQNG